jgi:RimJ/RimL family protein N-acetyltransferase
MAFVRVSPDDPTAVARFTEITNAALAVDDPEQTPAIAELVAGNLAYGWDLEPGEAYLYHPDDAADPVGAFQLNAPKRDNRHLVHGGVVVHPDHRRQGHGTVMAEEIIRRARELGRNTVWGGCWADDAGAATFLKKHGFAYASHDARRFQYLAELDHAQLDRLYDQAQQKAADYELVRLQIPTDDEILAELVEVTAAINDAPMGDLTFEDEKFDLQRLKDFEYAAQAKGERMYRVFARHKRTGAVGGHTVMDVQPKLPTYGGQYDTAVHRDHRGHRLGMLLKLEMMRWMAEVEPQLERIETWNHADNRYMIDVNEAIGYRLSRVSDDYERKLD